VGRGPKDDGQKAGRVPEIPVGTRRARPQRAKRPPIVIPEPVAPYAEITTSFQSEVERRDAKSVADEVVRVFRYALLGLLAIGLCGTVVVVINPSATNTIEKFLESYLKAAAGFLGQVFGSLLLLIFGFYFGRHSNKP